MILLDSNIVIYLRDPKLSNIKNYSFDEHVTKLVIELRRTHVMQLPDAIIAATTLVNDLVLWTHNTAAFEEIPGIRLFDPVLSK